MSEPHLQNPEVRAEAEEEEEEEKGHWTDGSVEFLREALWVLSTSSVSRVRIIV